MVAERDPSDRGSAQDTKVAFKVQVGAAFAGAAGDLPVVEVSKETVDEDGPVGYVVLAMAVHVPYGRVYVLISNIA